MSPPTTLTVPQAFALALQHHHAGRLAEAKALYREILVAEPNHADALHHLGILAHQVGRNDLAVELIGQAIRLEPKSPGAHLNLGEAWRVTGRLDEAIACYHRALELKPDYAEAHNNLGTALAKAGRLDEALAAFRRALELKPDYPDAHNKLGIALVEQGKLDEGLATFRRAIELRSNSPETHVNLGNALKIKGQRDEAVAAFRRALQLKPDYLEAHYNLGTTLRDLGLLEEAIVCYQRALALNPNFAEGHLSLGLASWLKGDIREAEVCYRRAITLRPDLADAHLNLGFLLLLLARYAEGWPEYEWRWQTPGHRRRRRNFSAPLWDGQPAGGKTILLHAEQGYGDTLQFVRYLPLVGARAQAARVILECQPPLVPLLQQLHSPQIDIVARGETDESLPPFDLHLPLLSLPLTLPCFDPLPIDAPYLRADAKLRTTWRKRLGRSKKLRVGLAWAGNPLQEDDHRRSIPLEKLAPLLGVPGIRFVSLQIEPRGSLPPALATAGVLDFSADIADFSDSAALLAELDLIITVDTATAHLAGALGCPVWVMVSFRPYWPYGLDREDTPWYPAMRLFRQTVLGDWTNVIERVATALRERAA